MIMKEKYYIKNFGSISNAWIIGVILALIPIGGAVIQTAVSLVGYCFLLFMTSCMDSENKWFKRAKTIFYMIMSCAFLQVIAQATPFYTSYQVYFWLLCSITYLIWFLYYYSWNQGMIEMAIEDEKQKIARTTALLFLFLALWQGFSYLGSIYNSRSILTFFSSSSHGVKIVLLIFGVIVIYIWNRSIRSLKKREIRKPYRVIKRIKVINCMFYFLCFVCIYIGGYAYSNWNENIAQVQIEDKEQIETILTQLKDKGTPQDIIQDLTNHDIKQIKSVKKVKSNEVFLNFHTKEKSGDISTITEEEKKDAKLKVTILYIESEEKELYSIYYWEWKKDFLYWNDGILISPRVGYVNGESVTINSSLVNGILLYEKDNKIYERSMPRLASDLTLLPGEKNPQLIICYANGQGGIGGITYPSGSSKQRGYMMLKYEQLPESIDKITELFCYGQNNRIMKFPYQYPERGLLLNGMDKERYYISEYVF